MKEIFYTLIGIGSVFLVLYLLESSNNTVFTKFYNKLPERYHQVAFFKESGFSPVSILEGRDPDNTSFYWEFPAIANDKVSVTCSEVCTNCKDLLTSMSHLQNGKNRLLTNILKNEDQFIIRKCRDNHIHYIFSDQFGYVGLLGNTIQK